MQPSQHRAPHAVVDRPALEAELAKLLPCDHAVLACGDTPDQPIDMDNRPRVVRVSERGHNFAADMNKGPHEQWAGSRDRLFVRAGCER